MQSLGFVVLPAGIFFVVSLLVLRDRGFSTAQILRDPVQQRGGSSFLGFLSSAGLWLWIMAVAIPIFVLLTERASLSTRRQEFLVLLAGFSMLLALDDFFQLHVDHVPAAVVFGGYAALAAALVLRQHAEIVATDGFAFLLAMALLAGSVAAEAAGKDLPVRIGAVEAIEEGCKFLGAATWLYFSGRAAALRS
jgi:hypothetical protein